MRKILLIGAGKSSSSLVKYLSDHSQAEDWKVIVADADKKHAEAITAKLPNCTSISFNATDEKEREQYIKDSDIVISLLPATLHALIATDCVSYGKHLVTASYTSPEIKELSTAAKNAGLIFLTEMGLDPGIDHMSAKRLIDDITGDGGTIDVFKSYCGGLIAPESDDNPWNYKVTWNPRNVVLAGQGTSRYFENGSIRYVPYHRLFSLVEKIKVPGGGSYDSYINRDSLKYIDPYGIGSAHTVVRGTLRHKGFCKKWNCLVALGITDDSFVIEDATNLTYRQFIESFLPPKMALDAFLWKNFEIEKGDKEYKAIEWMGLVSDDKIGLTYITPAQILQKLIEKKLKLKAKDKDLTVMYHELHYTKGKKETVLQSSFELTGENNQYTAMAKTVGLPLAIGTKLILNGKITTKGVQIPVQKEIYKPVLKELEEYGVVFKEKTAPKKKGFAVNFKLF